MTVEALETELNSGDHPSFPTVAITGDGVMEAFAAITENTLVSLADRLGIDTTGHAVERLKQQTRAALEPFVTAVPSPAAADDIEITVPENPPDETGPLPQETLLSEAVRANLAMTDLSTRLETVGRLLERKARVTRAITEFRPHHRQRARPGGSACGSWSRPCRLTSRCRVRRYWSFPRPDSCVRRW